MRNKRLWFLTLATIVFISGIFLSVTTSQATAQPTEVVSKRTQTSRTMSLGNGHFALDVSLASIYYKDTNSDWTPIDNTITANQMTKADYNFSILQSTFNQGQIVQFSKGTDYVRLQPMNLDWTNDSSQIQQINSPQAVSGIVSNPLEPIISNPSNQMGTVTWDNAYGTGTQFSWQCEPNRLVKLLTVDSFATLPTPASYIISGGNPVLRLNLIFAPSDELSIYVDGQLWDKSTTQQTFNAIEFRKNGVAIFGFSPLLYWDSSGHNSGQSIATLRKAGQNLYIEVRVPYSWLQTATYPVFIDATIDLQVSASSDDCCEGHNDPFSLVNNMGGYFFLAAGYYDAALHQYETGERFLNVLIPNNPASIDVAYMTFTANENRASNTCSTDIYGFAADNSATFSTNADFDGRTRTTNMVNWTSIPAWTVNLTYNTPSLTAIVEEIVDRGGWVSGNAMAFTWEDKDGESSGVYAIRFAYSYDGSTTKCPRLHVEYTASSASSQPWDYTITHNMLAGGLAPKSQAAHSINGVSIFTFQSDNGTPSAISYGTLNMTADKITNVADPTAAQDAVTKAYVDNRTSTNGTFTTLFVSQNSTFGGTISLDTPTELTVSGGNVTKTKSFHTVDTEGNAPSDDLDIINGGLVGDELILSGANDAREVQLTDVGNIRFKVDSMIEGFSFSSPAGSSGIFYTAGYDMVPVTDANLNQVSPTIAYGTALSPYGAHAILVAAAAGTTDAGTVSIKVSGTSVDEDGVRVATDNETLVTDITTMALNQFYETTKVWVGTITYTLVPAGGATTYAADFNYGLIAYDSFGKKLFHITSFEMMGRAGADDAGFNIQFLKHSHTGWTYSADAFVPGSTPICSLATDYGVEHALKSNERFKYERNLDDIIDGTAGEGFLIRITTTANKAVEFMNASIYADVTASDFHITNTYTTVRLVYNGTYWMEE